MPWWINESFFGRSGFYGPSVHEIPAGELSYGKSQAQAWCFFLYMCSLIGRVNFHVKTFMITKSRSTVGYDMLIEPLLWALHACGNSPDGSHFADVYLVVADAPWGWFAASSWQRRRCCSIVPLWSHHCSELYCWMQRFGGVASIIIIRSERISPNYMKFQWSVLPSRSNSVTRELSCKFGRSGIGIGWQAWGSSMSLPLCS